MQRELFAVERPDPSTIIAVEQLSAAINDLAELLSKGLSLDDCADHMQISRGSVCAVLAQLCGLYGEEVRG